MNRGLLSSTMPDEDVTQAAPTGDALPTTKLGPAAATATALAWSDGTGSLPAAGDDYEPERARWWPVAALVAVILVVTGGAAGVILWLGHHQAAPPPVAERPAVTPGPLNGLYRFDWHDEQATNRMPDGSVQTVPADWGVVDTRWYAIRSYCEHGVCTATRLQLDDSTHSQADPTKDTPYEMTLVNGRWSIAPAVTRMPCTEQPGEEDLWEMTYNLMQLPDGSLAGNQVDTVTTNECGVGGMVRTTPISGTRMGDVPSTVKWNG